MKTVRVRIAVAVQADGEWSSAGWSGREEDVYLQQVAGENFEGEQPVQWVWVEADVPVPDPSPPDVTVTGKVTPA